MALPADPRTRKKTKPAAPTRVPGGLPAAPTYDIGALMAGLPKYPTSAAYRPAAHATAAAQTAATVRALRAQQAQINQQAALQAQQINQATLAGANFLNGLGLADKLQSGLSSAAADQAALASGYSGGLQQTMADQAAKVQQGLAAISGPGGVPSTAAQAGNVLYGLGGALPASALLAGAPYAAAAARALPATMLGTGQQAAYGALGAGRTEAARLNPQIGEAIAGLPALEASTLAQLQKQAADARNDAIANMWKAVQVSQAGDSAEATRLWRDAQLKAAEAKRLADAAKPGPTHYYQDAAGNDYAINPDGSIQKLPGQPKPASTSGGFRYTDAAGNDYSVSADGTITRLPGKKAPPKPSTGVPGEIVGTAGTGKSVVTYDPKTGQVKVTPLPGPLGKPAKPAKKPGNLTPDQVRHLRSGISSVFFGVPEHLDSNGKTVPELPRGSYQDAIKEAILSGYSLSDAKKMANRFYKPGVRGRPAPPTFFADPQGSVSDSVRGYGGR